MEIGQKLNEIRKSQNLSQGDVEEKTGLSRCYLSRIENGHTIPSLETLEKLAIAFQIPLYQFFTEAGGGIKVPPLPRTKAEPIFGDNHGEAVALSKLRKHLAQMSPRDRGILLTLTHRMAKRRKAGGGDE